MDKGTASAHQSTDHAEHGSTTRKRQARTPLLPQKMPCALSVKDQRTPSTYDDGQRLHDLLHPVVCIAQVEFHQSADDRTIALQNVHHLQRVVHDVA